MASKYVVCPDCEGEGSHGPGFVWTQDEIDEQFRDLEDFANMQARLRAGEFNTPCEFCEGKRVVTREQAEGWQEELEYRAMVEAERRMGC